MWTQGKKKALWLNWGMESPEEPYEMCLKTIHQGKTGETAVL